MNLPTVTAYTTAMQHPAACLQGMEGRNLQCPRDSRQQPLHFTGNFVATFKLLVDNQAWAVRCYHRAAPEAALRINALRRFLAQTPPSLRSALLEVCFVARGIHVEGADHPVVWMPWSEATPLRSWVAAHLGQTGRFRSLQDQFRQIVCDLERAGATHGDLQAGNLLVGPQGHPVLVDYDSFTVPETRHLAGQCRGLGCFQHPGFDPGRHPQVADRMPALVLTVSLEILARRPDLWAAFGGQSEGLLFETTDLAAPQASPLFHRLRQDPALLPWARLLEHHLSRPPEALPSLQVLLGRSRAPELPGLGDPAQREYLGRLMSKKPVVPDLAHPTQPAPSPLTRPATPGSGRPIPALPASIPIPAPAKPSRHPWVKALPLAGLALVALGWHRHRFQPGTRATPPAGTSLPHAVPTTPNAAASNPRMETLRKELRTYLERHNPREAAAILADFDRQLGGLDPASPGFKELLNHLVLHAHLRSS